MDIINATLGYMIGAAILSQSIVLYRKYNAYRADKNELKDLNAANAANGLPTFDTLAEYDTWSWAETQRQIDAFREKVLAEDAAKEAEEAAKKRRSAAAKKAAATKKAAAAIPAKKTANTSRTRKA